MIKSLVFCPQKSPMAAPDVERLPVFADPRPPGRAGTENTGDQRSRQTEDAPIFYGLGHLRTIVIYPRGAPWRPRIGKYGNRSTRGRHGDFWGRIRAILSIIVWKSLLEKYEARVEYNHGGYLVDLVIVHDRSATDIRMKYWRDETTTKIYSDILRLQSFPRGGFLLVFSANPKNLTDENIQSIEALSGIGGSASSYRSNGKPKGRLVIWFWFAGWPVPRQLRI